MKDENQNTEYDKAILELMMATFQNLIDPTKIQEQTQSAPEIPSIQPLIATNKQTIVNNLEVGDFPTTNSLTTTNARFSSRINDVSCVNYISEQLHCDINKKQTHKVSHSNTSISSHTSNFSEPFQIITPSIPKNSDNSDLIILPTISSPNTIVKKPELIFVDRGASASTPLREWTNDNVQKFKSIGYNEPFEIITPILGTNNTTIDDESEYYDVPTSFNYS